MTEYCEAADIYDAGLPRGSIPNAGRALASADSVADTIVLAEHGLGQDDTFELKTEAGGTVPAPLAIGTTYYAIPVSANVLQIAAVAGGAPIDLTSPGTPNRTLLIVPLQRRIDAARAWASRVIDDMLPAGAVPLTLPVPELVKFTAAELAIGKLLAPTGGAAKPLADLVDDAKKRLARWAQGVPLRGDNAPEPTMIAQVATAPVTDPRGWSRFGGIGRC